MKIEDAMNQATEGPLQVKKERVWELLAEGENKVVAEVEEDDDNAQIDALLLAHWYNHGQKLLEMLKQSAALMNHAGGFTDTVGQAMEAIAAASEVEGI